MTGLSSVLIRPLAPDPGSNGSGGPTPRRRSPRQLWDKLEIRLVSREAEAVILYDPNFPADLFAH